MSKLNQNIIVLCLVFVAFLIFSLKEAKEGAAARAVKEPLWKEIREYQPTIKPEMIISITPESRYIGKPIVDWKLDKLALAMASVPMKRVCTNRSTRLLGGLTIEIDTTGTEIESDVYLLFANTGEAFVACFRLYVMQDSESYVSSSFGGKELIEWAKSVGIAGKENWD